MDTRKEKREGDRKQPGERQWNQKGEEGDRKQPGEGQWNQKEGVQDGEAGRRSRWQQETEWFGEMMSRPYASGYWRGEN